MIDSKPGWAFLLGWPFSAKGGVNGVLSNLLREMHAGGTFSPVAVEVSGRGEGDANNGALPWRSVCTNAVCGWDSANPWRSLLLFVLQCPRAILKWTRLCRGHSIEVLNPHFIGTEHFVLWPLRRLGIFRGRLILSFHGADIREIIRSRGVERILFRKLLRCADALVPCSDGLREEMFLFDPVSASRAVAVHNGFNVDEFTKQPAAPCVLPPLFRGQKLVLNVAAYEYKKGHDILLRAFRLVRNLLSDAVLVIAGQRTSADCARLSEDLGLTDCVLLLENIPHADVMALLRQADLFVLSSRWEKGVCGEGFAMALLEAGGAELPVVSSRSCGVSELIEDGVSGRVVPTEDPEALAAAICGMLGDPAAAARMGQNLNRTVRERFTWRQACEKYVQLARR